MKSILVNLIRSVLGLDRPLTARQFLTVDHGFKYRMGAGFPGTPNRNHPASILPRLQDTTAGQASDQYGQFLLYGTIAGTVRKFVAGDTAVTTAIGVSVRSFPFQQQATTNYGDASFGSATPPNVGEIDMMNWGFITTKVNGSPKLGDPVFVWCAASTGSHVQGMPEAAASAGNTAALTNAVFMNSPDADGYVEIQIKN